VGEGVRIKTRASIFEGAVIGDRTVLEEDVVIKPEVKVWPQKTIEAATVVSESVVWSEKVPRGIFTRRGITGDLNGEMTPEKLVRLGRTLGTLLPLGSRVVLGYEWSHAALMAKQALGAGLMASGLEIVDLGRIMIPVLRYAVRELKAVRGFHVAVDGDKLALLAVNQYGVDLTKAEERRIETLFSREEYRPINPGLIQETRYVPDLTRSYMNGMIRELGSELISRRRYRVAIGADQPKVSEGVASLLNRLGVDVVRVDRSDRADSEITPAAINQVVNQTVRMGADLGLYLEECGQKAVLITPEGKVLRDEYLLALTSLLFAERFKTVYLPVDAPLAIEEQMRRSGRPVIRTRVATGEFMQDLVKAEEWEQLRLSSDGIYLTVRLLEAMARLDLSLPELLAGMPPFFYDKREVPISWRQKGRVIRRLAETSSGAGLQGVEGIRVWQDAGSSLILPDEDRPVCRIYSESFSQEIAQSLSDFCIETIKEICQEEE